jgi:localization factor PodJL
MKFGVPWSVKGIRPEARETAKEAARRSGMSLADWLNSVIIHQAEQEGIDPDALAQDDDDGDDLASVHQRLDAISRRIEKVARTGPAAYAPRRSHNEPDQLAELVHRLDRRLDQFANVTRPAPAPLPSPQVYTPPALDMAVAEIAARQRALNGQPSGQAPLARQPTMPAVVAPRAPLPTQDLSGLEDQLRTITSQIETLRKPGVEEAINALRDELGKIAHTITDAMPRREIDTIERQIADLTQRIAEGRQQGVDGNALAGIEHGLAEVRDALHHLTPAESLVGFNDAVAGLAHKIDMIVAQQDPATMQQLEYAVNTLRDISAHVASNETVGQLAAEVQRLAQNVEHIAIASGGGDALAHLERRINALSEALAERAQTGGTVPPRLEELVYSLSDKIEQIQNSRGGGGAVGHLEDVIAGLVQKLDASDSRLGHLEAIERGLADLLVHIEDIKAGRGGTHADAAPVVDSIKHEIARTQDTLDAVHGTLGQVVDRLAVIEQGIGETRSRPMPPDDFEPLYLSQPVGKLGVRLVDAAAPTPHFPEQAAPPLAMESPPLEPAPPMAAEPEQPPPPPAFAEPPAAPAYAAPPIARMFAAPPTAPAVAEPPPPPKRVPAAHQLPIDPDLPPDQPLEPGSGPPRSRANPAARIAASEAALGGSRPAPTPAAGSNSNFIAAARRAAQAAVQDQTPPRRPRGVAEFMEPEADEAATPSLREKLSKRVKSLFVAAGIIAVMIGGVQIASNFIDFGGSADKVAQTPPANAGPKVAAQPAGKLDAPATVASIPEPVQQSAAPLATVPAPSNVAELPTLNMAPPGPTVSVPPLWNAPSANLPGFITGSISKPVNIPAAQPAPLVLPPAHDGDRLPAAIGGIRLRSAATAGDAAAAYEVGVRYAEGRGVPADVAEAARWFERASSKGLAPAQFRYGSLLEKGQGVKKDLPQARRLYLAAATNGNAKAMHNLAVIYVEGIDGKPDYGTAAQWFRKAADRGIPDSQFNLGVLYARGLGVPTSLTESYKWFALAASKGDKEAAKQRDEITGRLDAQTLAGAQLAVRSFVVGPQPDAAVNVPVPPGGWDNAATGAPANVKPRAAGPLVLGKR